MFEFKPEKLFRDFKNGVSESDGIIPRTYTMTHSDETQDLFVTVGIIYDWDKITEVRDEVLAEWVNEDGKYKMKVYVHVDGQKGLKETTVRNEIFRKELPLALTAIRYADHRFFNKNSDLDDSPIIVHFNSSIDEYNNKENWGTFKQYKTCNKEKVQEETSNQKYKVKNMDRDITNECELEKDVIVNFLNPYIQNQIWITYGRIQYFCLSEVEVLSITPIKIDNPCKRKFEVAVGMKVGQDPPPYNNMIIEFLVTSNGVTTKSVKNPR